MHPPHSGHLGTLDARPTLFTIVHRKLELARRHDTSCALGLLGVRLRHTRCLLRQSLGFRQSEVTAVNEGHPLAHPRSAKARTKTVGERIQQLKTTCGLGDMNWSLVSVQKMNRMSNLGAFKMKRLWGVMGLL